MDSIPEAIWSLGSSFQLRSSVCPKPTETSPGYGNKYPKQCTSKNFLFLGRVDTWLFSFPPPPTSFFQVKRRELIPVILMSYWDHVENFLWLWKTRRNSGTIPCLLPAHPFRLPHLLQRMVSFGWAGIFSSASLTLAISCSLECRDGGSFPRRFCVELSPSSDTKRRNAFSGVHYPPRASTVLLMDRNGKAWRVPGTNCLLNLFPFSKDK